MALRLQFGVLRRAFTSCTHHAGFMGLPRNHAIKASFCSSSGMHDDFKPRTRSYANEASDVHAQISKDVEENKVVVYMKGVPDAPMCGFSNTVVQILKAEGVSFKGFNVLADPDLREGIKTFSKWPTIPQVYVNGEFIGGCDTTMEMYKNGELRKMLEEVADSK